MPDPIEELESFTVPGPAMNPLPATEVRRRGTRRRRRTNALVAVGSIAVVAAIAAPFGVLAGWQAAPSPTPAPAPATWIQDVPQDFPLAEGMFGSPRVTDRSGVDPITLCGATAWSPAAPVATVDLAGATRRGLEEQAGRTLALYADDQAAGRALAEIRSAVQSCPRDENGTGAPLVHEALTPDLGGDDSFTFIERSRSGRLLADLTLVEVVRAGNALYLDHSYGAAGDDRAVATAVSLMGNRSEEVRTRLCAFTATGCSE
jgi:hypothetical protein